MEGTSNEAYASNKHTTTMSQTLRKGDVVFKDFKAKKDAGRFGKVYDVKETPKGTKVKVEYNTQQEGEKSRFSVYQSTENFTKVRSSWREWYVPPPAKEEHDKTKPEIPKPETLKKTHYDIIGIAKDATASEIKKAYFKKVLQVHPDKGGSNDEFRMVQQAYEVLRDINKRLLYDMRMA